MTAVDVTVEDGKIVYVEGTTPVWTVVSRGDGKIALSNGTKYLTYSSSTNLGQATSEYDWTLEEIANIDNTYKVVSKDTSRGLVYRASSYNQFGGYALTNVSSSSKEYYGVQFYKLTESTITNPETPGTTECAHANTTTTNTATCTEAGVETVTCADCGATVSTNNVDPKGHTDANGDSTCDTCGTAMGSQPSEPVEKTETMNIFGTTGTLNGGESISWTSGDITLTNKKGGTAIRTSDSDHYRVYAGSTVTVSTSSGKITKLVITCASSSYATVMQTSLNNNGYSATVSGSVVTVDISTAPVEEITFTASAQTRLSKIVVTYSA